MLRPGNSFNLDESVELTNDGNTPKPFIEIQPTSTTDVSLANKSMESVAAPSSRADSDKGLDTCDETRSTDNPPTPIMAGPPVEKQDSVATSSGQFSPLATLGQAAECTMLSGQAVDDVTIVDIILHELKYCMNVCICVCLSVCVSAMLSVVCMHVCTYVCDDV